jgi:release factor glutamine methyltransferase
MAEPIVAGETVQQALQRVRSLLTAAGVDSAAGDARRLLAAALDATAADLISDPARILTAAEAAGLAQFADRRGQREPVSRILGEREFYGRPFVLTPAVLDPRPDTETLIDVALDICRAEGWRDQPITILDVGTGSGALLLTLLAELPHARGLGIDISAAALACAGDNALRLGLEQRARFQRHDMRLGLPSGLPAIASSSVTSRFDLVISNPPYIEAAAIADLDPEVARFDPTVALDGGSDGLDYYRAISAALAAGPESGSQVPQWVVLEIGRGQEREVIEIARRDGHLGANEPTMVRPDLGGINRCVALRTRSHLRKQKPLE